MSSVLDSYAPVKGEIERRKTGSLVAFESGEACTYGLFNAQERGVLFIGPARRSMPVWSSASARATRI